MRSTFRSASLRQLSRCLHQSAVATSTSGLKRTPNQLVTPSLIYSHTRHALASYALSSQPMFDLTSQRRSMVVVTKTKANTIADNEPQEEPSNNPAAAAAGGTTPATAENGNQDLIITDACWKQIQRLAAKKNVPPSDLFLRVYVDAGGCSGFEYKFEVETDQDAIEEDDIIWQGPDGVRVVVDESSLGFVKGATLDYVVEMIKSAFTVRDNPLSESACGCGSSFAVKNFSNNPALD